MAGSQAGAGVGETELRQSFVFLTHSAVRLEFHVSADLAGIVLTTLYNPPREPDATTFGTVEEMAEGMAERVALHLEEHSERLSRIRWRHDLVPITYLHLGRYGVSILPEKEGSEDRLGHDPH